MAKVAKPSKNEIAAAKAGMSVKEWNAKKKKSSSGSEKNYKSVVDSILKSTPAQQKVLPDFETTYTPELQAEDMAQSEALYKPFFEHQIANELEDLNAWSQSENTDYERNLRRARISLGQGGGAIGNERDTVESEITTDRNARRANTLRETERSIGTEALQGAGFSSGGAVQEGEKIGKMKEAIQAGQLWYKNQRAQRYYGDAKTYYSQPASTSLAGTSL